MIVVSFTAKVMMVLVVAVISVVVEVTVAVVVEVLLLVVIAVVLVILIVPIVLVVVILVVVVVGSLLCAEVVIDAFVEVLEVDMRADAAVIASDLAVGVDTLMCGVLTNIDVGVLVDANVNVFAGIMTAVEYAMPGPLEEEEFRC